MSNVAQYTKAGITFPLIPAKKFPLSLEALIKRTVWVFFSFIKHKVDKSKAIFNNDAINKTCLGEDLLSDNTTTWALKFCPLMDFTSQL